MKEVYKFLDSYLKDGDTIVCATSGGVDSMVLLNVLIDYSKDKNIKTICAHINHNLREESKEEYEFVRGFCENKGVLFEGLILEKNITGNLESEFRKRRYNFFDKICLKYKSKYLFTAHHGDDLIETILMRLVRGSSLEGYLGFKKEVKKERYCILRPLIYVTKDDIYSYAKENKIGYMEDKTNESDNYTRNRYRKYILPRLKEENKNVHKKFLEYSEEIDNSYNFIHNYVNDIFKDRYYDSSLDLDGISDLDSFIIEKLLFEFFKVEYAKDINLITKPHILEVMKIIRSSKPNLSIDLPSNKVIQKSYDILTIKQKENIENYKYEIGSDGIKLPMGTIKIVSDTNLTDNYVCHLNTNEVKMPLYVRNRRDGDYIEVLGMNGKKKIKDIFIDSKINIDERDKYPIVVDSDDKILWIPGIKKSKYNVLKSKKYDIILWYVKEDNNE